VNDFYSGQGRTRTKRAECLSSGITPRLHRHPLALSLCQAKEVEPEL
jgi:hypothetical protein